MNLKNRLKVTLAASTLSLALSPVAMADGGLSAVAIAKGAGQVLKNAPEITRGVNEVLTETGSIVTNLQEISGKLASNPELISGTTRQTKTIVFAQDQAMLKEAEELKHGDWSVERCQDFTVRFGKTLGLRTAAEFDVDMTILRHPVAKAVKAIVSITPTKISAGGKEFSYEVGLNSAEKYTDETRGEVYITLRSLNKSTLLSQGKAIARGFKFDLTSNTDPDASVVQFEGKDSSLVAEYLSMGRCDIERM